jgi:hypothetical protein
VPLAERGISFWWFWHFVDDVLSEWVPVSEPVSTEDFVRRVVVPLTKRHRCPLFARVPAEFRGKPTIFVSHVWRSRLAQTPYGLLATIDWAEDRQRKEHTVWLDIVSYNQHEVKTDRIAADMLEVIRSCRSLRVALSTEPFFHRTWCLWELLGACQTNINVAMCDTLPRSQKYASTEMQFRRPHFESVRQSRALFESERHALLNATEETFGTIEAADDIVRDMIDGFLRAEDGGPVNHKIYRGYKAALKEAGTNPEKLEQALEALLTPDANENALHCAARWYLARVVCRQGPPLAFYSHEDVRRALLKQLMLFDVAHRPEPLSVWRRISDYVFRSFHR